MAKGLVLAIVLLGSARGIAAQKPAPPTSAQTAFLAPSEMPAATVPASPAGCQPPAPSTTTPPPPDAWHCVTVNFNYDFSKTPPCATVKPGKRCVAQFAIYDTTSVINGGTSYLLFYVPLPTPPSGAVSVSLQSPKPIDLVLGWHKLEAVALDTKGNQSAMQTCASCATWIWVQVEPTSTPSVPAPGYSNMPPATPPASPAPASPPTT